MCVIGTAVFFVLVAVVVFFVMWCCVGLCELARSGWASKSAVKTVYVNENA